MMRLPPGVPRISTGFPSFATIVGLIELRGALPGAMAFALAPTRPASGVKSSISSFISTPVPVATTRAPNQSLSVYVIATALPAWSMIEKCVVLLPS